MINGRFGDTTGRPYVEGRFIFPHQPGNVWAWCSFIIDTGAERSVLLPVDARRMGLDRTKLVQTANSLGIGGNAPGHNEYAVVILGDDERGRLYEFRLTEVAFIPEDTDEMREIDASVLGRDVLDRVRLVYDKRDRRVTLEVLDFDREWSVTPGLFEDGPSAVLR